MTWKIDDPQGNESAKIRWELVPYTRGVGLDLGCGAYKTFPHFIGVDNLTDRRLFGTQMQPDIVIPTCEKLSIFATQSMNFVFSSHLLEHIEDTKASLAEWWRVIKVGGYLCLYLPHKDFYPNIGQEGANPDHKHDFLPKDIVAAMEEVADGWDLVENQERNEGFEYSFFQVYKKLGHKTHLKSCDKPKPEKTCAVVRYGAFGDLLMASNVFPGLKEQGYHLTLYTVDRGYEAVRHDPNIDRVILQEQEQVPNAKLSEFFDYLATKYDKLINLCESVEGTFLALQGRTHARFNKEARHMLMNFNYVEFACELSGVPFSHPQKFHTTKDEMEWAEKERARIGGDYVIMWALSGSSVHKHWPHLDTIVARLLLANRNIRIVMVGDDSCKLIESAWENESRVIRKSGVWTIRQSMSFLDQCDMVIGPETGVLNAAAMLDVAKIVTLSHSTIENLTKHWKNCVSLVPPKTPCYPCHMMHYGFDTCTPGYMNINGKDERVGSLCQVNIGPEQMWEAIEPYLIRKAA